VRKNLGLAHFGGLFWPTPWDVDVEGVRFCFRYALRATLQQNRAPQGYSFVFFRRVLRKRYDSEPVSMMCA
jgi:hypothetical protein